MPKKIIDITPPDREKKQVFSALGFKKKKGFFQKNPADYENGQGDDERTSKEKSFGRFLLKFLAVLAFAAALVGLAWFSSGFYSRLALTVKPRTEPLVLKQEAEVNISQEKLDIEDRIIPGRFFSADKSKSERFKVQSKDYLGQKAEGIIRVYNSLNPPQAITLRSTTRFLSSNGGKVFRTPEKIYLKPASFVNGKLKPSFKDVRVVAQEEGEEYNIGPSKFSVPGLAGTALYYSIWAESTKEMKGGFKKEVRVAAKEDFDSAESSLKADLIEAAKNSLKSKLPSGFVFNDSGLMVKDFQFSCSEKEGDRTDWLNCQADIEIVVLSFKMEDLKQIIMNQIVKEMPPSKRFNPQSLTIDFSSKGLVSQAGKMILDLTGQIKIYDKINKEFMVSQIKGLKEKQIKDLIFKNFPQIKEIKLKFWPFWVKKAPGNPERITFELTF